MPTIEQRLASLEGFLGDHLGYAPPVDAPVPQPPPVVTPPAPAPQPSGFYAEIGGIPSGLSVLDDGRDLSKLAGPAIIRPNGKYIISGDLGVSLYANGPGLLIPLPARHQATIAKGVTLAGWGVTGGGLAKTTNADDAAIVTSDGVTLHSFEMTRAFGVGLLFKGSGLRAFDLHSHHNGTSGRMIRSRGDNKTKGSGFHEVRSHLHHNNIGGKDSDAANKGTQTSDYLGEDCRYHDEEEGAQWWDISCWGIVMVRPDIRNITTTAESYRAVGVRFELNIYGTYPSGVFGGYIGNLPGAAVAVNESSNITVDGMEIGPCAQSLELRQMTRNDDPGDGTLDPANWFKPSSKPRTGPGRPGGAKLGWEVFDVRFTNNKLLPGAGPIALSSAGNDSSKPHTKDLSQLRNRIVIANNTGNVAIKIPA